jgi:hypothetical protein
LVNIGVISASAHGIQLLPKGDTAAMVAAQGHTRLHLAGVGDAAMTQEAPVACKGWKVDWGTSDGHFTTCIGKPLYLVKSGNWGMDYCWNKKHSMLYTDPDAFSCLRVFYYYRLQ